MRIHPHIAVILSLTPACMTDDLGSDEPIAEVTLDNGSVIQFFEPQPGAIAIMQEYKKDFGPIDTIGRSAVDVFRSLQAGEVPETLMAAQLRANEARSHRTPSIHVPWIDNTTVDDHWFFNTYCGGSWDIISCQLNRTTNYLHGFSDTDEFYLAGCSDRGTQTLHSTVDGDQGSWTLVEGHCRYYHWISGWLNVTAFGEVTGVNGTDRYHVSARYRD